MTQASGILLVLSLRLSAVQSGIEEVVGVWAEQEQQYHLDQGRRRKEKTTREALPEILAPSVISEEEQQKVRETILEDSGELERENAEQCETVAENQEDFVALSDLMVHLPEDGEDTAKAVKMTAADDSVARLSEGRQSAAKINSMGWSAPAQTRGLNKRPLSFSQNVPHR